MKKEGSIFLGNENAHIRYKKRTFLEEHFQ